MFDEFFLHTAKAWQSYIPYNFLQGINLSNEQLRVVDLEEEQLLITGGAGSGKSITLLYKMIKTMVQEKEPARFVYISFNQSLVDDARKRAERSVQFRELRNHHDVQIVTFHSMAYWLLKIMKKEVQPIKLRYDRMEGVIDDAIRRVESAMYPYKDSNELKYQQLELRERLYKTHIAKFVRDEIFWMKANGYITLDDYLNVSRIGRGNIPRLERSQRATIYKIFEKYQSDLKHKYGNAMDLEDYALRIIEIIDCMPQDLKYDYIYVDEVQDLQPMQIKLLTMLAKQQIVFSGDNKQRIYKTSSHTYEKLGLAKMKRRNLIENFRSTKQIMQLANSLKFIDTDNDKEANVRYVREGIKPIIRRFDQGKKYIQHLVKRIREIHEKDKLSTIAVIIRNDDSVKTKQPHPISEFLKRYFSTIDIEKYGKEFSYEKKEKQIVVTDVYSVKGLEFDYVFIMDFDRKHYPLKSKLEELNGYLEDNKGGESRDFQKDLDEIINDEKKRLYVAMSRAKKELEMLYLGVSEKAISEFVRDFREEDYVLY